MNDEKKCEDNNGGEGNIEINFKNGGDPSADEQQHFHINFKIILPPKSCTNDIYQLFSLKFFITFDVPTIIVKRILSPEWMIDSFISGTKFNLEKSWKYLWNNTHAFCFMKNEIKSFEMKKYSGDLSFAFLEV